MALLAVFRQRNSVLVSGNERKVKAVFVEDKFGAVVEGNSEYSVRQDISQTHFWAVIHPLTYISVFVQGGNLELLFILV